MFKPNDLVTMTKHGFAYNGNVERIREDYSVGTEVTQRAFEQAICELMSIQGVGTVLEVKEDALKIRWRHSVKGMFYYFTMWYNVDDVAKLSLFKKLKYKLLGRI